MGAENGRYNSIVETGTFRGVTTEFMASNSPVCVYSIEANRRNYGFSRARLRRVRNVELYCGDSVMHLALLLPRLLLRGSGFFYLDAHWDTHLPLLEELEGIFSKTLDVVVMIDDFQVPEDPGYRFDDYCQAGTLCLEYIAEIMEHYEITAFFPRCPSSQENGALRGMVLLATGELAKTLDQLSSVRRWKG